MDMCDFQKEEENMILCACSAYEEKFYLNPQFNQLPGAVKEELQIMCVLYTMEIGGILILEFTSGGSLELMVSARENDLAFDEIGSALKIKQIRSAKAELFEALELFYRGFIRKEDVSALMEKGYEA